MTPTPRSKSEVELGVEEDLCPSIDLVARECRFRLQQFLVDGENATTAFKINELQCCCKEPILL